MGYYFLRWLPDYYLDGKEKDEEINWLFAAGYSCLKQPLVWINAMPPRTYIRLGYDTAILGVSYNFISFEPNAPA